MQFCIRDDDTSFFTTPEQLELAYGQVKRVGPVSLSVVPFHRAGPSKGVPEKFRGRGTVHALHDNRELVDYLRAEAAAGRFEVMLHGYYHDEPAGHPEFARGNDLTRRAVEGRAYLEDLLGTAVRVFVPPHNAIGRQGLAAIAAGGLHLGGVAGIRGGWPLWSSRSWKLWRRLRRWRKSGGTGVPWVLDLGDHREIAGNAITPFSNLDAQRAAFKAALRVGGVFCAATHYWELQEPSAHVHHPSVGGQLQSLIELATSEPSVTWRSVGDAVCARSALML